MQKECDLERMRVEAGVSISQLAKRAGVSRSTLYKALEGESVRQEIRARVLAALEPRNLLAGKSRPDAFLVMAAELESFASYLKLLAQGEIERDLDKDDIMLFRNVIRQIDNARVQAARVHSKIDRKLERD